MIEVVQGYEVHLLDARADIGILTDSAEKSDAAPINTPSIFQRIALFFKSIFNGLLK